MPALTTRQLAVLQGVASGLTDAEIGRRLEISENTVRSHLRVAMARLGARSRAHAVAVMDDKGRRWRVAA